MTTFVLTEPLLAEIDVQHELAIVLEQLTPYDQGNRLKAATKLLHTPEAVELDIEAELATVHSDKHSYTLSYIDMATPCTCGDHTKRHIDWCKHRLCAVAAYRLGVRLRLIDPRLSDEEQAREQEQEPPPHANDGPEPGTVVLPLPEAPASINCYVDLAGRRCQITLRDTNEQRLVRRLEALLQQLPTADDTAGTGTNGDPSEAWCPTHQAPMKLRGTLPDTWYSHRVGDNTWCNGNDMPAPGRIPCPAHPGKQLFRNADGSYSHKMGDVYCYGK